MIEKLPVSNTVEPL